MVTGMKLQLSGIFIILCLINVVPGVVDAETVTYELTIAEEKNGWILFSDSEGRDGWALADQLGKI